MGQDIEKMIAVGLVWGATNALMRRGAIIWDQTLKATSNPNKTHKNPLLKTLKKWLTLLLIWQYSVPFNLNLTASATFFAILSDTRISIAVPVTNATTFAATAVFGMVLGEETHVGLALFGTLLIVLGVYVCVTRGPPVGGGREGTLGNANRPIPLACPCPKIAAPGYEGCTIPVNLDKPTSCCPVISIPQTGINHHPLLVRVPNPQKLIVSEDSKWQAINVPPETIPRVWHVYERPPATALYSRASITTKLHQQLRNSQLSSPFKSKKDKACF
ncbi:hypothetical protein RJ639_018687 [Escallonia herrerae]|uniref:Transmembrane protein 234 homolog n=1 Tax=Escallonia herrerae TaxID=1293975 RepID=A0AA89AIL6_9ASTE|nr:hypothetical protein RJ639_018687 [Escallonia herrerae]